MASEDDCLQMCKDQYNALDEDDDSSSRCEWYTYYPDSKECFLFEGCPKIVPEDCEECSSGERLCELQDPGGGRNLISYPYSWKLQGKYVKKWQYNYDTLPTDSNMNRLLVLNGYKQEGIESEAFDLHGQELECEKPAQFPVRLNGAAGA